VEHVPFTAHSEPENGMDTFQNKTNFILMQISGAYLIYLAEVQS
jgi:hypothetical protein